MDGLNKVTQDYGLSADELFTGLAKQGGAFKNLGFEVDETAVLIGRLSDAGINLRKQGPAIEAFLGRVVKAGGDPATALGELEARIKGAASDTEALQIATEAFGQSYGSRFGAAIRTGALSLAGISEEAQGAAGNLAATWEETLTLQDRWKLFTGSLSRELNERVFPHLGTFVGWLQKAVDGVDNLDGWLDRMVDGPMGRIADWVRSVWPAIVSGGKDIWYTVRNIASVMWDLVDGPLKWIGGWLKWTWQPILDVSMAFINTMLSAGRTVARFVSEKFGALTAAVDAFSWPDHPPEYVLQWKFVESEDSVRPPTETQMPPPNLSTTWEFILKNPGLIIGTIASVAGLLTGRPALLIAGLVSLGVGAVQTYQSSEDNWLRTFVDEKILPPLNSMKSWFDENAPIVTAVATGMWDTLFGLATDGADKSPWGAGEGDRV